MASKSRINKTLPTEVAPAAYIATVVNEMRRRDAERLLAHFRQLTGKEPCMWGPSIIGFGQFHYRYDSGHEGDSFLAGFSPRKAETVVYLMGQIPDQTELLGGLGPHRMGKGCLYIRNLDKIDFTVLTELVNKSVAALKAKYPTS